MLTSIQINGISPFTPGSTFACDGLSIPRGMFLGGCFYTAQDFIAPCHISYIAPPNGQYLSTWGVADAAGVALATVYFDIPVEDAPIVGNIVGTDNQYAGCIKARGTSYTNEILPAGDLSIFLRGLTKQYTLDPQTLVFDICCCTRLARNRTTAPTVAEISLPEDCGLALDDNNNYYMSSLVTPNTTTALKSLGFQYSSGASTYEVVLSGTHISILPWCITASAASPVSSGSYIVSGGSVNGAQDIVVDVVDGAIVIATRKNFSELNG